MLFHNLFTGKMKQFVSYKYSYFKNYSSPFFFTLASCFLDEMGGGGIVDAIIQARKNKAILAIRINADVIMRLTYNKAIK